MTKRAILGGVAMLAISFNPVLVAPAFAGPNHDPIHDTTGLTPQEICDAQLHPDERSEFTTSPENTSEGDWVVLDTEIGDPVGDPYGVGTPVASNIFLNGSFYRNGGSPNVWGGATATLTYPQTGQMYETEVTERRTTTFDCHVHKDTGTHVEPPGLQSTGNSTIEEQSNPGPDEEVISEDDFIVEGATVNALICISPNKVTKGKPGTWVGKHGFDPAGCPAANIAAGGPVPSNNAPEF